MPDRTPEERRHRRCFQRVMSGLEKGGGFRLVTLTSSRAARNPIQRDFRRLIARLRRRAQLQDYLRVVELTKNGSEHIHMIFRGSYIEQAYVSHLWDLLHQSPIVDVRAVKLAKGGKYQVANELAKYMAKQGHRRYSWSWNWVYKGFVATWLRANALFRQTNRYLIPEMPYTNLLKLWQIHLHTLSPPLQFLSFLFDQLQLVKSQYKPQLST